MEYRIEELEAFEMVGLAVDCKFNDISGIMPLWDRFIEHMKRLQWNNPVWGACLNNDDPEGFRYICGYQVPAAIDTPEGLERFSVPAHKYVVHPFHGQPKEMSAYWRGIYPELLAAAGLQGKVDGPWLEWYSHDCYDEATGKLKCDLYTPVAG